MAAAALDRRLFQVRYSVCVAEVAAAAHRRLSVAESPWDVIGPYRGVCQGITSLDDHGQVRIEYSAYDPAPAYASLEPPASGSYPRLTLRYRDTLFYVEDARTPLDGGELQFWDLYATRGGDRDTTDAWFVRVVVDVPRRQVQILRRYEFHAGGYLADDTYEVVLAATLRVLTGVPGAYLTRRSRSGTRGFQIHPDPLDPVKAAEGPSVLQWILDRTAAAAAALPS